MAGDWIKLQTCTPDKPEVYLLAEELDIDPDAVVGKLVRIWCWADAQTRDGYATVTKALLDRITGVTGFTIAMLHVGWLVETEHGFMFPNFERHNGKTAKTRAMGTVRVQNHRSKSADDVTCNADVTQMKRDTSNSSVTKALPEKRREEKNSYSLSEMIGENVVPKALDDSDVQALVKWWNHLNANTHKSVTPGSPQIESLLSVAVGDKANGVDIQHMVENAIGNGWLTLQPDKSRRKAKTKDKPADQDKTFLAMVRVANQHGGDTNSDRDWRKDPKNVPREWHMALRATNLNWEKLRNDNAFERRRMAEMLLEAIGDAKARLILEPAS